MTLGNEPIQVSFTLEEAKGILNEMFGAWHRHGPVREFLKLLHEAVEEEEKKQLSSKTVETVARNQELCLHCSNTRGAHSGVDSCPANEGRMDFMRGDLAHSFVPSGIYELPKHTEEYRQRSWTRTLHLPYPDEEIAERLNREGNVIMKKGAKT
jgi:hypothetical protein